MARQSRLMHVSWLTGATITAGALCLGVAGCSTAGSPASTPATSAVSTATPSPASTWSSWLAQASAALSQCTDAVSALPNVSQEATSACETSMAALEARAPTELARTISITSLECQSAFGSVYFVGSDPQAASMKARAALASLSTQIANFAQQEGLAFTR